MSEVLGDCDITDMSRSHPAMLDENNSRGNELIRLLLLLGQIGYPGPRRGVGDVPVIITHDDRCPDLILPFHFIRGKCYLSLIGCYLKRLLLRLSTSSKKHACEYES